jgi:uncharacterized protein
MIELSIVEARVLGCLLEKERTTPEYYPLSINALTNACNQKSNRRPVLSLDEATVREAADTLREKKLVMMFHGADARVPKFKHTLANLFELEAGERAILCELLLRGPQTPGELRSRAERMHRFDNLSAVEEALKSLAEYPVEPLVTQLPRQPGQKEQRYMHLLSGPPSEEDLASPPAGSPPAPAAGTNPDRERIERLEEEVAALRGEVGELRAELERFRNQFE